MPETDESLLRSFAATRDSDAFRTLARRYLGLIFHAALRRTGNRQLAEEVSQNVLCALARKAGSLAGDPGRLPAWLHRAAVFESTKAMRSEMSHQRRKQLRHPDQIPSTADPAASPWEDVVPHLDEVLDQLPEADRRVLFLHYFENRSFLHIAGALGKSRAAVEKQSQRALRKLSRFLHGRGVILPAGAIAAGISPEMAKAAPAHLLPAVLAPALAVPAATVSSPLLLLMKSKAALPLVVLACAAPLALQQNAISRASRENERLRGPASFTASRSSPASSLSTASLSSNIDIYVLLQESDATMLSGSSEAFQAKLDALPPETLVRLIRENGRARAHFERKEHLLNQLISALALTSPGLAVKTTFDAFESLDELERVIGGRGDRIFDRNQTVRRQLVNWAKRDPDAALAWFLDQAASGKFPRAGPRSISFFDSSLGTPLFHELVAAGHPGASVLASERNDAASNDAASLFGKSFMFGVNHDPDLRSPEDRTNKHRILANYLYFIRDYFSDTMRAGTLAHAFDFSSHGSAISDALEFFRYAQTTDRETEAIAVAVARLLQYPRTPFDPEREEVIKTKVSSFLKEALPEQADALLGKIAMEDARWRSAHAGSVLERLQRDADVTDRYLAEELTHHDFRSHPREALEQAARIRDPKLRESTINTLRSR